VAAHSALAAFPETHLTVLLSFILHHQQAIKPIVTFINT